MAEHHAQPNPHRDGGRFTSPDCDFLEIREEDTMPGPGLSEKAKQRLREKYGGKMPPPSDPSEPDYLEIREEDSQPGIVSDSYRKHLREKYGPKHTPPNTAPPNGSKPE